MEGIAWGLLVVNEGWKDWSLGGWKGAGEGGVQWHSSTPGQTEHPFSPSICASVFVLSHSQTCQASVELLHLIRCICYCMCLHAYMCAIVKGAHNQGF